MTATDHKDPSCAGDGRGRKKELWESRTLRVPMALIPKVQLLINQYRMERLKEKIDSLKADGADLDVDG